MKERNFFRRGLPSVTCFREILDESFFKTNKRKHFVGMRISGKTMEMSEIHSRFLKKAINDNEKISST